MLHRILRSFSFKPQKPLEFIDKKALIVKSNDLDSSLKYYITGLVAIPGLMLYRLLANHSSMGWINFLVSFGVFSWTSSLSKICCKGLSNLVIEMNLFDDGKNIEITTFFIGKKKHVIQIKDIINPEDNAQTRMKMQYFNLWALETNKGNCFYIMPESTAYQKEVLKEILKGQEIDISKKIQSNENNDNIIDV